eukprot:m.121277 g.121277  ORF g.121277 m.121277 type:complete len:111 (-) comp23272_c3_seq3:31-363(-)
MSMNQMKEMCWNQSSSCNHETTCREGTDSPLFRTDACEKFETSGPSGFTSWLCRNPLLPPTSVFESLTVTEFRSRMKLTTTTTRTTTRARATTKTFQPTQNNKGKQKLEE